MLNILKPDFIYGDERGLLIQLVREGYKQVNVIESVSGAERGNHYHKLNREVFFIIRGHVILDLEDISETQNNQAKRCKTYEFMKGDMFEISPYVNHRFTFLENTILVSMYDKGVELNDGKKDIYQLEG